MNKLQYSTPETAQTPWPKRIISIVALAASATATSLVVESSQENSHAQADVVHHVEGTGGEGLWLRTAPDVASEKLVLMPEGAEFAIRCWTKGQDIDGNTIWQRGIYDGQEGVASDRYLDTGYYPTGEELTANGIPECNNETSFPIDEDINVTSGDGIEIQVPEVTYDREAAASWALEHAQDLQDPRYPGCTWFVSQALWYGGLPKNDEWTSEGRHGHPLRGMKGTPTATAVRGLLGYLEGKYPHSWLELDFGKNDVPEAEVGDILAYEWDAADGESGWDHIAMVVSKNGQYPIVAEWGTVEPTDPTSDYQARGWTWSEKTSNWLQKTYPNARATLFKLNLHNS